MMIFDTVCENLENLFSLWKILTKVTSLNITISKLIFT